MIKKILIPLDGSELSERILDRAGSLLARPGTAVTILTVLPGEEIAGTGERVIHSDKARRYLEATVKKVEVDGVTVEGELRTGDPADQILQMIEKRRPDLVCMSTHGRSGFERILRGSIAERVLRRSTRPVLLLNPFTTKSDTPIETILVPVDGSKASSEAIPLATELARVFGSKLVLLHAAPDAVPGPGQAESRTEEMASQILELHKSRLERTGVETRIRIEREVPVAAILRAIDEEKADLVAMTTHGRSGLSRWIFGSVSEDVLRHAPCPVLVLRASETEPEVMAEIDLEAEAEAEAEAKARAEAEATSE